MRKRIFAWILGVLLVLTMLPMGTLKANAQEIDEEGEKTWIEVCTPLDLYNIRNDLSANYRLMNDIDLSAVTGEAGDLNYMGNGWNPIGSDNIYAAIPFTGTFDGNNCKISGLNMIALKGVSGATDYYYGLFSCNQGTIMNLELQDVHVDAIASSDNSSRANYTGTIAAINKGTISNCSVSGSVKDSAYGSSAKCYLGGICAVNEGNIINVCNKASVRTERAWTLTTICGGIVGSNLGVISMSYNVGDVYIDLSRYGSRMDGYVGGIAGRNSKTIENSYNSGKVLGEKSYDYSNIYKGGIAGYGAGISYSYNSGTINNNGKKNEEVYGISYTSGDANTRCYYLDKYGKNSTGSSALTSAQMTIESMYVGFDFENVWIIDPNTAYPYPQLRSNRQATENTVEAIEWATEPSKTEYNLGDTSLDLTGAQIRVYNIDDTSEIIDVTADMLSGYDLLVEGNQTVTLNYHGRTLSFEITVVPSDVVALKITTPPSKIEYIQGEALDTTDMVVTVVYNNGFESETTDYTIQGDPDKLGNITITVVCNGYEDIFDTFDIVVSHKVGAHILEYNNGDETYTCTLCEEVISQGVYDACFNEINIESDAEGLVFDYSNMENVVYVLLRNPDCEIKKLDFDECVNLKYLDLGNVSDIEEISIEGCDNLETVILHENDPLGIARSIACDIEYVAHDFGEKGEADVCSICGIMKITSEEISCEVIKPENNQDNPTVVLKRDTVALKENEDYTVQIDSTMNGTIKKYTIHIQGLGAYMGAREEAYELDTFVAGWTKVDGAWMYAKADGTYAKGWEKIGAKWYCFDESGVMLKGWQKLDGKWYYLDGGAMTTGWKQINSKWYYFGSSGVMTTGWKQIKDVWYYFDANGAMVTGWKKISNVWYYFDEGAMVTGWKKISNVWYYFDDGAMVTGWKKISNVWYYFDEGAMVTGWKQIKNVWYYFDGGAMVTGTKTISGKSYTFDSNGAWIK